MGSAAGEIKTVHLARVSLSAWKLSSSALPHKGYEPN